MARAGARSSPRHRPRRPPARSGRSSRRRAGPAWTAVPADRRRGTARDSPAVRRAGPRAAHSTRYCGRWRLRRRMCRSGRAAGAPAARRPAGRARPTAAARRVQSERPGAETDRGRHEVCGGEGGNRAGKPSMIIHRGRRRGMRYAARLSPIPLESATCKVRVPGTSCLISAITPIPSPPAPSKPSPTWSAHVAACAPAGPTRPSPMDWATGRRTCVPGASRTAALRGNSGPSSWAT